MDWLGPALIFLTALGVIVVLQVLLLRAVERQSGILDVWRNTAVVYPAPKDIQGSGPFRTQPVRQRDRKPSWDKSCTVRANDRGVLVRQGSTFPMFILRTRIFVPWEAFSEPRQAKLYGFLGVRGIELSIKSSNMDLRLYRKD